MIKGEDWSNPPQKIEIEISKENIRNCNPKLKLNRSLLETFAEGSDTVTIRVPDKYIFERCITYELTKDESEYVQAKFFMSSRKRQLRYELVNTY